MTVVAVTGCSGYIGSRLSKFMEEDDRISRIIGIDVKAPAFTSRKLEFHSLDVRDRGITELFCKEGVEKVVHLAFIVDPIHDTKLMQDIDVGGCRNVLTATSECGAGHLVVASSTSAFGALPDNPEWLSEEHPPRRQANYQYASDKYDAEILLNEFKNGHQGIKARRSDHQSSSVQTSTTTSPASSCAFPSSPVSGEPVRRCSSYTRMTSRGSFTA